MKHRFNRVGAVTHQTMVLFLIIATLIVGSVSFLRLGNQRIPASTYPP
jgi:multidrug efflux pump subunit AcrB